MKTIILTIDEKVYKDMKSDLWAYGLTHGKGNTMIIQAMGKIFTAIQDNEKEIVLQYKKKELKR